MQANLRTRKARGEKIVVNDKTTSAELAEEWFEAKSRRLRTSTRTNYRKELDNVLLACFGTWKVSAVDVDAVADLISDLETKGFTQSTAAARDVS
jgi:integrase-like protein